MRSRPGRYVGHKDIEEAAYAVSVPQATSYEEHQERTRYIRDHCRRENWSNCATQWGKPLAIYLFLNQEDAMHFKMRFG